MENMKLPGFLKRYEPPATGDANAHAAVIITQDADATSQWYCGTQVSTQPWGQKNYQQEARKMG